MRRDYLSWLPDLETVARQAGAAIMDVYATDFQVDYKDDQSPVTDADSRAEALILPVLSGLSPAYPILAEEQVAAGRIPTIGQSFWLVDPLDGTKEFIKRNGEFTVNVGLIVDGLPVLGVVYAPALDVMWSAADGQAWRHDATGRHPIRCRQAPARGAVIVTSRSHRNPAGMDRWMADYPDAVLDFAGSSLKFCKVADGSADYYPRFGPTCEWDTAAGHAVLRAAGGEVCTFDGAPLAYGKENFLNPDFIARSCP